ncbi:hypothetical protein N2152v2_000745 [Parachlorella kessleri]
MVTTSPAPTGDQRAKAVVCHFRLGWLTADGFCSVALVQQPQQVPPPLPQQQQPQHTLHAQQQQQQQQQPQHALHTQQQQRDAQTEEQEDHKGEEQLLAAAGLARVLLALLGHVVDSDDSASVHRPGALKRSGTPLTSELPGFSLVADMLAAIDAHSRTLQRLPFPPQTSLMVLPAPDARHGHRPAVSALPASGVPAGLHLRPLSLLCLSCLLGTADGPPARDKSGAAGSSVAGESLPQVIQSSDTADARSGTVGSSAGADTCRQGLPRCHSSCQDCSVGVTSGLHPLLQQR